MWDLFRVENGAGKTIYIEVEKDGKTIAPRFAYAIPETQDTDPRQRMPTLPRPTTLAMPTPLASPKLSR